MRHIRVGVISLVSLASVASSASAELVTVFCSAVGAGRSVSVVHQGATRNVFAGQIMLSLTNSSSGSYNGSWISFCTELSQNIYVNGAAQVYEVLPVSMVPNPGPGMGDARAAAIARMYTFASNAQFGADADFAAAFQVSLWEISNDYDGTSASLNLSSGNLRAAALSAPVHATATALLAAAADTSIFSKSLVGLGNAGFQDQIIDPSVPVPGPATMALLGLASAIGARRRRR